MKRFLVALITLLVLSSCSNVEERKLKVITSVGYPPFEMSEDGEFVGFDIDLINELATRLDYEIEIVNFRFESLFTKLYNEEADLAISAISKTDERDQIVDFSIPYFVEFDKNRDVLIFHSNREITSLADLDGMELGVEVGSVQAQIASISQAYYGFKIKLYNNIDESITSLVNNEVDALLVEVEFAEAILLVNNDLSKIEIDSCEVDCNYGYVIAFPEGSDLIDEFNEGIEALIEEGYIDKLKEKWLK